MATFDLHPRMESAIKGYFEHQRSFSPYNFNVPTEKLEKFRAGYNILKQNSSSTETKKSEFFKHSPTFDLDLPPSFGFDDPPLGRDEKTEFVRHLVQIYMVIRNHWVCVSEFQDRLHAQLEKAPTQLGAFKVQGHEKFGAGWLETLEGLKVKASGWDKELNKMNSALLQVWWRGAP
ncbi:MAG: hypothetical protein Q9216_005457 [Gyalolechia sp. 2 TL-2023]